MKKFMIWYNAEWDEVDDIVYAENIIEAIKTFIILHKGKYNVYKVQEVF